MNGVNLESGKKPLRERSPFIDVPMINCAGIAEADKFFDDLEARSSPRLIKTHYPFEFLPPTLLETCKVTLVSVVLFIPWPQSTRNFISIAII